MCKQIPSLIENLNKMSLTSSIFTVALTKYFIARVCAVSRCYRAEVSALEEEQGIYRVHQFTKVSLFLLFINFPNFILVYIYIKGICINFVSEKGIYCDIVPVSACRVNEENNDNSIYF